MVIKVQSVSLFFNNPYSATTAANIAMNAAPTAPIPLGVFSDAAPFMITPGIPI
jgi:hypothetical protein